MDKDILKNLEKGREHYEAREFDKAEAYLLKVSEEERFADVMNMLGVIYHDKGQVARAQSYFESALRINPNYTEAALNLAVTYNEQGQYDQAKRIYTHVTTRPRGPDGSIEPFARGKLANMHADLGRAYAELCMWQEAAREYRAALVLSPDFADIRTRLGQLLKDAGDLEGAVSELRAAVAQRPSYVPARVTLGVTHFAKGDRQAAREAWEGVLLVDPSNRTAAMYLRMMDQLSSRPSATTADGEEHPDELSFSFDGVRASVMPADDDEGNSSPK
ncbi:MAG: tetratricopeptide repeat protein [Myxococcota bacterium]|jgi:tetratricopeptide (TPR) repeat protein|nr:tetratricopeptide repeat protein [Myxococcota bacterium]